MMSEKSEDEESNEVTVTGAPKTLVEPGMIEFGAIRRGRIRLDFGKIGFKCTIRFEAEAVSQVRFGSTCFVCEGKCCKAYSDVQSAKAFSSS